MPMPHDLNDLTPAFRILAEQLLAQWRAAHPDDPLIITCTLRTLAEQDAAKAAGRSQIRQSKHLPQPPDQLSHALDVCPKSIALVGIGRNGHWIRLAVGRTLG